jgi:hypothetical protein
MFVSSMVEAGLGNGADSCHCVMTACTRFDYSQPVGQLCNTCGMYMLLPALQCC